MRTKLFFVVFLLNVILVPCHAELSVTLNVENPGTLPNLIASSKKYVIPRLTLTGRLNGSDIRYIREMAGANCWATSGSGTESNGALRYLNLSGASIVSGGDYYAHEHGDGGRIYDKVFYTKTDVITPFMFVDCWKMDTVLLPNTVHKIDENAFWEKGFKLISLPEYLDSIVGYIPSYQEIKLPETNHLFKLVDGVLFSSDMKTLYRCPVTYPYSTFQIPEGVEIVYMEAFKNCNNIKKFDVPSSLNSFGYRSLRYLNLSQFVVDPNVSYHAVGCNTNIDELIIKDGFITFNAYCLDGGGYYYKGSIINNVKIFCPTPPVISMFEGFESDTYKGNLYVPKGSYSSYYVAYGWGDFAHIYEMEDEGPNENNKCANPTISYKNGQIQFDCETEGVSFVSTVYCYDNKSYNTAAVPLTLIYRVSVFSKKEGYEDSDIVTKEISIRGLKGDVNEDGEINISDINSTIDIILSH